MATLGLPQDSLARVGNHPLAQWLVKRGPALAVVLLLLVIAWQLAGIVWHLFPQREDSPVALTAPPAASNTGTADAPSRVDVSAIVERHLFGIATAETKPEPGPGPGPEEDVEETTLPLVLRGTLAADSKEHALAIIVDGRDEKLYRLGDTVRRGVTLHAVQTTQVILNSNGNLEALSLPKDETRPTTPVRRASATRRATTTPTVTQVLTQNASRFTEIISPRPYFVNGQQRGYRLYAGKDRKQFQQLGLRQGDIVTEINGTALTNPTEGARIFSELGDAQSVTVTIERNGVPQSLTLDVGQLDLGGNPDN